jgi:cytochrome c-type biogenesis protein CcmH/NrfG
VWLVAVLLAIVTIALYWPATSHDFLNYDDYLFISNVHVQNGLTWESLGWAFLNPDLDLGYWQPITLLSHMADCQLFGLKPWGHHLTSVLLHAVNTALVFLLLRSMTGAVWRSVLVAALFGWHPMQVESVAWVAERKGVLSACFGLLALIFYVRYARKSEAGSQKVGGEDDFGSRPATLDYGLAMSFFVLGLMSKPMLVTWPFVMLLLDYWPLKRISGLKRLLLEKIPFVALAAAASIVTFVVMKQGGSVIAVESQPLGARGGNALISYCRYLGKLFWPAHLAAFYPHPGYWPLAEVLLAGVFLCGVSVLLWVKRERYPFLLMGWLWFCGTLVPMIQLVQQGSHSMADRYVYIPSLGVLILVVWGAYELTRRWRHHVIALSLAGSVAIVCCLTITRHQLGYWQDTITLFQHALEVTENNYFAHNNIGSTLGMRGQTDKAISQFQEAIRLKPDYAEAHVNLGLALLKEGQPDGAINQFQEAIRLKPDSPYAHYNLGVTLFNTGQTSKAMIQYQEAVRLKPEYGPGFTNFCNLLALSNQAWELATSPDPGIRDGARAVDLAESACEQTHYRITIMVGTLAAAYAEAGRFDEAIATGQKACALASELGDTNLFKKNQELVTFYQAHQPYHESPSNPDASQPH